MPTLFNFKYKFIRCEIWNQEILSLARFRQDLENSRPFLSNQIFKTWLMSDLTFDGASLPLFPGPLLFLSKTLALTRSQSSLSLL